MSKHLCGNCEIGSYKGLIELMPPPHLRRDDGRGICVDVCLAIEISNLWRMGISTTGCCCGHGIVEPYIGVADADIPKMIAMGYRTCPNETDPTREDGFYPKSIATPAPSRCDELKTVGWLWEYAQYRTDERGYYGYETVITENNPKDHVSPAEKLRNIRELVTRQNAEAVIAAKDARIAELDRECDDIADKNNEDVRQLHRAMNEFAKLEEKYEALEADNKRLREALERIADWPNGGKNYGQENIKRFARTALRGGEAMKDLIDRLSKLDGPDREVDAEICTLLQYGGENSEEATNVRTDPKWDGDLLFEIGNEDCCNPIPEITSSVDAAIALAERVLPECRWSVGFSRHVPHSAQIWVTSGSGYYEGESDANRAIALCIAILRAKEASHDAR